MFILAEGETFNTENELANDIGADFYATNLSSTIDWAEELYKKIKW